MTILVGSLRRAALTRSLALLPVPCALFLLTALPRPMAASPSPAIPTPTATPTVAAPPTPPPSLWGAGLIEACDARETTFIIHGSDFLEVPTVQLGDVSPTRVAFEGEMRLSGTLRGILPAGIYAVAVTNPDGQQARLPDAISIHRGDEHLGPWRCAPRLTVAREMHATAATRDWVYALGGYAGVPISSTERAAINPDGSLGPWRAARPLPQPRSIFSAVATHGYLYVLGGCCDGNDGSKSVYRAAILADGELGPWESMSPLLVPIGQDSAAVWRDHVYAVSPGRSYGAPSESQWTRIAPDGSLEPWRQGPPLMVRRGLGALVATAGFLYAVGGDWAEQSVERAAIQADGTLGPWEPTTSLREIRRQHAVAAAGGYLYAIGGYGQRAATASVERARVQADGSLGPWEPASSLTAPAMNLGAVATGGFLYAVGGGGVNSDLTRVQAAALDPGPTPTAGAMAFFPQIARARTGANW